MLCYGSRVLSDHNSLPGVFLLSLSSPFQAHRFLSCVLKAPSLLQTCPASGMRRNACLAYLGTTAGDDSFQSGIFSLCLKQFGILVLC